MTNREQRIGDGIVQHPGQFAPVFAVRRDRRNEMQFRMNNRTARNFLRSTLLLLPQ
jgi:hypothetical protein